MTRSPHGRPDGYSCKFDNVAIPRACVKLIPSQIQRRGPVCAGAEMPTPGVVSEPG